MSHWNMESVSQSIDRIAEYDFENHKGFAAAYLVCRDGEVLQKCYGTSAPEGGAPVNDRTLFRLASMTKPFTAVATLILLERGLLSLDDAVHRFLPEFKDIKIFDAQGTAMEPACLPTIKNILTHTSGIARNVGKMTPTDKASSDALITFCLKNGLDYVPNERQQYSGVAAFDVLTKIIELVSQMDYESFLKKEIFDVCGMCDTTFMPTAEQFSRMVTMHDRVDDKNVEGKTYADCVFLDFPATHFLGGAGLASTLYDYACFADMLLHDGLAKGGRVLKEQTLRLMKTPHVSEAIMPGRERWGLGVRVITDEHYTLPLGSFGWSGAFGSHFWIDPTNQLYAVYMKNSLVDGGASNQSARNFERAVYGEM